MIIKKLVKIFIFEYFSYYQLLNFNNYLISDFTQNDENGTTIWDYTRTITNVYIY